MKKVLLLLFLISTVSFSISFAQNKTVAGKVTSISDGLPLPGVSVSVKGFPSIGSQTDAQGLFRLDVPASSNSLIFKYIGFKQKEAAITSGVMNIQLEDDQTQLSEVVVVGYGTQIKQDLTGSVAQVNAKDLENIPVTSFESALQGKATGVFVESQNGKVGQGIKIRVRGSASVSAGNDPLYVVDGIVITTANLSSTEASTNPLADINTNDIESIEVLKDASAAAIYGARASNGVVLITTKTGKAGKSSINFSAFGGVSSPTGHREFMNSEQYVQITRRAGKGAAKQDFDAGFYSTLAEAETDYEGFVESRLNRYSAGNDDYNTFKVNTDWESLAYQNNPVIQQYDLNFNGGNDKTTFYIAGQYLNQDGIIVANGYKKYSGRVNLNHKVTDFIDMGLNLNVTNSVNDRVSNDNAFSTPIQIVALSPITPLIDPRSGLLSGSLPGVASNYPVYFNPLLSVDNAFYKTNVYRNIGKIFANVKLAPALKFTTDFSVDNLNQNEENYYGTLTFRNTGTNNGSGYNSSDFVVNINTNNFLSYTKSFGAKHNFDAVLGTSYQKQTIRSNSVSGEQFPSDAYKKIQSAATKTDGSSTETAFSFLSYFFRGNYKFNDKYLATFSARYDGSSRFGASNRYGFFPAGSLGWIISEENFLKNNDLVSFLKARVSYGLTGNSEIGNFASRGLYSGNGAYGGLAGQLPSQIKNPELSWEETQQLDIGLDYGIVNNRISGSFDYYEKKTNGLLLNVPVPATTGFTTFTKNVGKLDNKGFEAAVNTQNFVGKFQWSSSITFSNNKNKITDLGGQTLGSNDINYGIEGQPIGVFYLPEYAGVDPANGDAIYYLNTKAADGTIDRTTTNDINSAERVFAGNPNPKYIYGFNNNFSFKGLDLTVFFQGVYGNDIFNAGGQYMSASASNGFDNQTLDELDYWDKPGDITNTPEPRLFFGNGVNNSSRYLSDGSYIRFKTLTLGYTLPLSVINRLKLSRVRIYATGQNLATFTKYKGWDPEVNADYQVSNINQGVDFYSAPQARVFSFGVNIGL
ncbi:MAG: TonB-dependent receptor [Flavobacterium sp.]|nr:TonB-dependent receptor [Pedobacter sp.]